MLYYKLIKGDIYDSGTRYTTIIHEIVTPAEKQKFFPNIKQECFKPVDIKPMDTYIHWNTI